MREIKNLELVAELKTIAAKKLDFAVIGGSGFQTLDEVEKLGQLDVANPFGAAVRLTVLRYQQHSFVFLPRHGSDHSVAPHSINYRANIWALKAAGIEQVLAFNAVGGIRADLAPGSVCIPDQIIDYSHGREATFFDGEHYPLDHIDFTEPLRGPLYHRLAAVQENNFATPLCYGCSQGPRLETAAEIRRMQRDGVDVVGMTLMPEAALARELGIDYCSLALVVNWAAGLTENDISMDDIYRELVHCKATSLRLLWRLLSQLACKIS